MTATFRLYSDGNYFPRAKRSGFGGYIKNQMDEIIAEFSEEIKDKQYIQNFELLGIIRGLQIAQAKGIKNIISHCDDKTTALRLKTIFEEGDFPVPQYGKPELYRQIMEIAKSFDSIKFVYIPRGQNKYADMLSRKYALLLEKNFIVKYKKELQDSQVTFSKGENEVLPKRLFFSHPNFVRILNRNNPYLVASFRNQRVRSITRVEEKKNYSFIFFETLIEDNEQVFRIYRFGQDQQRKDTTTIKYPAVNGEIENCAKITTHILKNNIQERVWIFSNHHKFNAIMEQKEKIPTSELAEHFKSIYKAIAPYKQVLFHHFPFEHTFSRNLQARAKKAERLKETYDSLESILEELKKGENSKDYTKHIGNLIRYHLRAYQQLINRDLKESEKTVIINKTFQLISDKNYEANIAEVLAA